jgi:hypothetical protein
VRLAWSGSDLFGPIGSKPVFPVRKTFLRGTSHFVPSASVAAPIPDAGAGSESASHFLL